MTLSQQLISLIRTKEVSESDLHRAAIFTLDAVANAMAGRNTEPGRKLLEWGRQQGRDAGRRAFVIGGLTHILETDDLHRMSVTHPGCVVVAAVVAAAETDAAIGEFRHRRVRPPVSIIVAGLRARETHGWPTVNQ